MTDKHDARPNSATVELDPRRGSAADACNAQPSTPSRATEQTPAGDRPPNAALPYLLVLVLGLLATAIVVVQLWAYRDELRAILTQTPV